jgi:uncharacterized protein (TIGR02246 family)
LHPAFASRQLCASADVGRTTAFKTIEARSKLPLPINVDNRAISARPPERAAGDGIWLKADVPDDARATREKAMQRRQVVLGMTSMMPAAALAAGSATARPTDSLAARVKQVVDLYEAAWNSSDMTAMAALYAPDVHWVNIVGMHWKGREEVDYAHRAMFDQSFRGVTSTFEEIESVVPFPGGGATAVVRWSVASYRAPSGQISPANRTRMSLVLVPDGDRLLIAHGANIQIVEGAQRSDPVWQRQAGPKS